MPISKQRMADFAAAKAREANTYKIKEEAKRPAVKAVNKKPAPKKDLSILGTGGLRKAGQAMSSRTSRIDSAIRKATR